MISRFVRDVQEGLLTTDTPVEESDYGFYPPSGHWGTPWLPGPNSEDEKLNLDKVQILYWFFLVKTIFGVLGFFKNAKCCKKNDETGATPGEQRGLNKEGNDAKASKGKKADGGSNGTSIFIGVVGLLAIHYDCRGLLMFLVVLSFISIILQLFAFTCGLLGLGVGLCMFGDTSDGIGDECAASLCVILTMVFFFFFHCAFDIAILTLSMPFIKQEAPAV